LPLSTRICVAPSPPLRDSFIATQRASPQSQPTPDVLKAAIAMESILFAAKNDRWESLKHTRAVCCRVYRHLPLGPDPVGTSDLKNLGCAARSANCFGIISPLIIVQKSTTPREANLASTSRDLTALRIARRQRGTYRQKHKRDSLQAPFVSMHEPGTSEF
jgi:hypothetical protein